MDEAGKYVVVASQPPLSLHPLPSSPISTSPVSQSVLRVAPPAMDERNCLPGESSDDNSTGLVRDMVKEVMTIVTKLSQDAAQD